MNLKFSDVMNKPFVEKEVVREIGMSRLFDNLDNALKKGELILNMRSSYETDHFILSMRKGRVMRTVRMYQFDNGVSIAQERYEEHGTQEVRTRGYPRCTWEHMPYSTESAFYFVYSGDTPVTDKEEVKVLIHQATGIKLPRLDIPRPKIFSSLELPSFGGYHEVVTDFKDVGKKPSKSDFSYRDEQPDEEDIARGLKGIVERIDSLKNEFVVESASDGLKGLREVAYTLYKQVEAKLPEDERLRLRVMKVGQRNISESNEE